MKFSIDIGIGDSFADATITSARKTKWYFGRDVSAHAVFQLECATSENTYETTLPVMLQDGEAWEFGRNDSRTVTEEDQNAAWDEMLAKFPAYNGEHTLSQDSLSTFIGWLKSGAAKCRIKLGGAYTDVNGVEHLKCTIVKTPAKRTDEAAKPMPPKAKKPAPAPAAKKPAPKCTAEDAWNAYEENCIKDDPHGAKYWSRVEEIVGKPQTDCDNFTDADWQKCVDTFTMPF